MIILFRKAIEKPYGCRDQICSKEMAVAAGKHLLAFMRRRRIANYTVCVFTYIYIYIYVHTSLSLSLYIYIYIDII